MYLRGVANATRWFWLFSSRTHLFFPVSDWMIDRKKKTNKQTNKNAFFCSVVKATGVLVLLLYETLSCNNYFSIHVESFNSYTDTQMHSCPWIPKRKEEKHHNLNLTYLNHNAFPQTWQMDLIPTQKKRPLREAGWQADSTGQSGLKSNDFVDKMLMPELRQRLICGIRNFP